MGSVLWGKIWYGYGLGYWALDIQRASERMGHALALGWFLFLMERFFLGRYLVWVWFRG